MKKKIKNNKFYKKKNIKKGVHVIYDNKKILNQLIQKTYKAILQLDTDSLSMVSFDVYKELISREDYNELDDILVKYRILQDELIRRGVDLHV